MLLVDLDNIMFVDGVFRVDVLKLRLRSISDLTEEVHWFCNEDTRESLRKGRIAIVGELHVCSSDTDSADHALVHHLQLHQMQMHERITIVTADDTLKRLALYVVPDLPLHFTSFGRGATLRTRAFRLMPFNNRMQLDKFIRTLNLFHARYPPPMPSPSSARPTPVTTASVSRRSPT